MKKIDVHVHTSMWENTQLQPGVILASPEELKENYEGFAKGEAYAVQQAKNKHYAKAMRPSAREGR